MTDLFSGISLSLQELQLDLAELHGAFASKPQKEGPGLKSFWVARS